MKYSKLLTELDEAGNVGLDLSPGDSLSRKAAEAIRELLAQQEFNDSELSAIAKRCEAHGPRDGDLASWATQAHSDRITLLRRLFEKK